MRYERAAPASCRRGFDFYRYAFNPLPCAPLAIHRLLPRSGPVSWREVGTTMPWNDDMKRHKRLSNAKTINGVVFSPDEQLRTKYSYSYLHPNCSCFLLSAPRAFPAVANCVISRCIHYRSGALDRHQLRPSAHCLGAGGVEAVVVVV